MNAASMYGSLNTVTGVWSGMIGDVMKGNADIAAGALTITAARYSF